jgi:hypothetical protein
MITRDSNGEIRFHCADDQDEVVSALKEVFTTSEAGRNYKQNFYTKETGDSDYEKLIKAAVQIAGGPMISSGNLTHALTLLIDSGEIQPRVAVQAVQLVEEPEDLRPRGRDGKVLSASQLKWQEFRVWSETASSDERKRRMSSDPDYASYVRKSLQAEMTQEIGGAVTPAGEPEKKIKANAELVDFVHKYNRSSRDSLKPRGGYVQLDGQPLLYSTFISLVERAAQARLL